MGKREQAGDHDTLTMARIYLDQGQVEEADVIYQRLVASAVGDTQEIRRLGELVQRARATADGVTPPGAETTPPPDRINLDRGEGGRLRCRWEITPEGRACASAQLAGAQGRLTLRLVAASPVSDRVDRQVQDHAIEGAVGDLLIEAPFPHGFVSAAVGLRAADGAFAPIIHAPPCRVADG